MFFRVPDESGQGNSALWMWQNARIPPLSVENMTKFYIVLDSDTHHLHKRQEDRRERCSWSNPIVSHLTGYGLHRQAHFLVLTQLTPKVVQVCLAGVRDLHQSSTMVGLHSYLTPCPVDGQKVCPSPPPSHILFPSCFCPVASLQ